MITIINFQFLISDSIVDYMADPMTDLMTDPWTLVVFFLSGFLSSIVVFFGNNHNPKSEVKADEEQWSFTAEGPQIFILCK